MNLKMLPFVQPEEHPLDRIVALPGSAGGWRDSAQGDVVLYRTPGGQVSPARLVEPAGGGCWLARDARGARGLIYLDPESITARLPRPDLLGEAA